MMGKRIFVLMLMSFLMPLCHIGTARAELSELEKKVEMLIQQNQALSQKLREVEQELAELKGMKKASKSEEIKKKIVSDNKNEPASRQYPNIQISGLLEFGGAWQDVERRDGKEESESDLAMTTVELHVDAGVGDWISAESTLLYEDPTFADDETSVDLDTATVRLGNKERFPVYLMAGVMYVPFGALFEHFPDDPLIDAPLTLGFGETREKAVLAGLDQSGFSFSAYLFNGDVEEKDQEDHIKDFGLDLNYSYRLLLGPHERYVKGTKFEPIPENCINLLAGISYISNIADSDGLTDAVGSEIEDSVSGFAAYFSSEYCGYFFEAEYMSALDKFSSRELTSGGSGARPSVWNFEAGFNYNWWKRLEVAFKYAGSNEAEGLGFPQGRYGINFNQELLEGVTASLGFIHDDYDKHDAEGRDERELVYWQLAVEF